jgi:hypothetical protein
MGSLNLRPPSTTERILTTLNKNISPRLSNFLLPDDYRVNNSAALESPVAAERRTS